VTLAAKQIASLDENSPFTRFIENYSGFLASLAENYEKM
jgi:hypothetical protein